MTATPFLKKKTKQTVAQASLPPIISSTLQFPSSSSSPESIIDDAGQAWTLRVSFSVDVRLKTLFTLKTHA